MTDSAAPSSRPVPVREDCWTEEASSTLIEAWGRRYLDLNRGNLRQKDWQQVADIVNARHGQTKKTHRTDVQCKNRIDTIKKKYKVEKARVSASAGMLASSWPFYDRLDELIGSNSKKPASAAGGAGSAVSVSVSESLSHSPPMALPLPYPYRKSAPLATAVLPKKRASPMDDSYFRRNYSAVAAAAAAAATADDDEEDDEDEDEDVRGEGEEEDDDFVQGFRGYEDSEDGIRKLARVIRKFGDVYEKVEAEKQNQLIEMEKQRMQLAKDLEVQRMQMFVNMQLQLKKIKIAKGNKSNGEST